MSPPPDGEPEAGDRGLGAALSGARLVSPGPITGQESPAELLRSAFPAFVGRQLRTAWELMGDCVGRGDTTFLTLSGAMTPAGLHASCIVPMVQRGWIDVLTTTGANLYHDAHRLIGHAIREIAPTADDAALRQARIIRIYDLGMDEQVLLDTDDLFSRMLASEALQRSVTTPELHHELGRQLHALEQKLGITQPCLLSACYQHGVPIFVGAPQDGSIFLSAVRLRALLGYAFRFQIDPIRDVYQMSAVQWMAQQAGETAVWILGGGVPKNYTLQGEPTLSQILGLDARGFDTDIQICVEIADNGALSSCPAGEGHTWGKVSAECVATRSVYLRSDVTAVLPWIVHALMSERGPRAPRRLYDRLDEAVATLDAAVADQRDSLLAQLNRGPQSYGDADRT